MRTASFTLAGIALASLSACSTVAPAGDRPAQTRPAIIENSLGMKLVRVPAGEFMMGSDERPESLALAYPQYAVEELQALGDEAPRHAVRINRAFYLGMHEVTVEQFRRFPPGLRLRAGVDRRWNRRLRLQPGL
jgi:formylglycine-generating enzyme required for sulfatase activity